MKGRHNSPDGRRGPLFLTLAALWAIAPGAAVVGAVGCAGVGWATDRLPVAAAGALAGAAGVAAERLQSRSLRRRARFDRARYRIENDQLQRSLDSTDRRLTETVEALERLAEKVAAHDRAAAGVPLVPLDPARLLDGSLGPAPVSPAVGLPLLTSAAAVPSAWFSQPSDSACSVDHAPVPLPAAVTISAIDLAEADRLVHAPAGADALPAPSGSLIVVRRGKHVA